MPAWRRRRAGIGVAASNAHHLRGAGDGFGGMAWQIIAQRAPVSRASRVRWRICDINRRTSFLSAVAPFLRATRIAHIINNSARRVWRGENRKRKGSIKRGEERKMKMSKGVMAK
jgi:hypothetical protein